MAGDDSTLAYRPARGSHADLSRIIPRQSYYAPSSNDSLGKLDTTAEAWQKRQQVKHGVNRVKTKRVKLIKGRYIAEHAVPSAVKNANYAGGYKQHTGVREFSHIRYTAATCDPDDFLAKDGYTFRVTEKYNRRTELCICITIYNEDKVLVARTLHAVCTNIKDMVTERWSEFRLPNKNKTKDPEAPDNVEDDGDNSWKKIVVTIIMDGLDPADKAVLDVFASIGIYQDAVMKADVDGQATVCHIFEATTQISMTGKPELVFPDKNTDRNNVLVPVQFILCIKAKNAKKINSHRWLFNAIGRQLQPEVCCLIDAGTKPGPRSLYLLWEAFHHNRNLGGCCGEIHAGPWTKQFLNPLVAAQNFEYKMSNILDKPTESSFGYVSVLPGAFSAYRYRAIQGRPLNQYFHGDASLQLRLGDAYRDLSIFQKNMFLAEDRILCFELVAKKGEKWSLSYVKPSKAETDVPTTAAELISQRRRWLNGSLAAGVYSLANFARVYYSSHSLLRLFFFHIQALFNFASLVMGLFQLSNFWNTFSIIIDIISESLRFPNQTGGGDPATVKCWSGSIFESQGDGSWTHRYNILGYLNEGLKILYLTTLFLQVILGLGNRPKAEKVTYTASIAVFTFLSLYLIACTFLLTGMALCPFSARLAEAQSHGEGFFSTLFNGTFAPIMAGLVGTLGVYVLSSILSLDAWHMLHSFPQYMLVAMSFTNVLNVYSFCNLHDVSWGTKGSDAAETLPSVHSKKRKDDSSSDGVAEVEEQTQSVVDHRFKQTVLRAVAPYKDNSPPEKPSLDDSNRTFRTRLVSAWIFMNFAVALVVERLPSNLRTYYFQALLWVTFALALFRGIGFLYYMSGEVMFRISRLFGRMLRRQPQAKSSTPPSTKQPKYLKRATKG